MFGKGRHFGSGPAARLWLHALALAVVALLAGCAVHYANPRTGTERLWGIGQLGMKTQALDSSHTGVTTGIRVFGLCLDGGRDTVGLSFGALERQRFFIITNNPSTTNAFAGSHALFLNSKGCKRWGLGYVRLKYPPCSREHLAIVTGRAVAGVGAHAGRDDSALSLGLERRQRVALPDDVSLACTQEAPAWPGFDLFSANVESTAANTNSNQTKGTP